MFKKMIDYVNSHPKFIKAINSKWDDENEPKQEL